MSDIDLKQFMARISDVRHRAKTLQYNAVCPHCGQNVLDFLEALAWDWQGFGPPEIRNFECDCGAELVYNLKWETVWAGASLQASDEDDEQ